MLLTVAAENGLTEFLGVFDHYGRIGGSDLLESLAEFLLVLLDLCLDGAAVLGCRESDPVIADARTGSGESRAGLAVLELDCAAEISGHENVDRLFLGACDGIDGRKALLVAGSGILKIHTAGDAA